MIKIIVLFAIANCYLQVLLRKRVLPQYHFPMINCSNYQDSQMQIYQTPCYTKDISYVQQFQYLQRYNISIYLGFDTNLPMSWIKSEECQIHDKDYVKIGDSELITFQERNRLEKAIQKIMKKLKIKMKQNKYPNHNLSSMARIQGSDVIFGQIERNHSINLRSRDSNKFASIINILKAGLFLDDQCSQVSFQNTTYMQAISINLFQSQKHDGVFSLMNTNNSFLDQILRKSQSGKVMTIWLDPSKQIGMMTFGQMSVKNVQGGLKSLKYFNFNKDKNSFQLGQVQLMDIKTQETKLLTKSKTPTVIFSLQASYIGVPQSIVQNFIKKTKQAANCSLDQKKFIVCEISKKFHHYELHLILQTDQSFKFTMQQLIRKKLKNKVVLQLRQTQSENIVLGQPFFNKYFVALDYKKGQIAYGLSRRTMGQKLFKTLTFVRFIVCIFIIGLLCILLFNPCRKLTKNLKLSYKMWDFKRSTDQKGLRYSPVQDHDTQLNYQQLKKQMNNYKSQNTQQL